MQTRQQMIATEPHGYGRGHTAAASVLTLGPQHDAVIGQELEIRHQTEAGTQQDGFVRTAWPGEEHRSAASYQSRGMQGQDA